MTFKQCTFKLNNQPMSEFVIGADKFPAFSGKSSYVNKPDVACTPDLGAIPLGNYFILDRESGGRLGWFRDLFSGRADWFSLYADDGKVDDKTICKQLEKQIERGAFRLHPKGTLGISQGCIVIESGTDFYRLRGILRTETPKPIPGSSLFAWAKVRVER